MFSTTQLEVIRPLVSEMKEKGYTSYLCLTNTLTGVTNDYDVFLYFSKSSISAVSAYKYTVPSGSLYYQVRTGAGSQQNQNARISITPVNGNTTLNIQPYQWISTNAEFQTAYPLQPDLCQISTVQGSDGLSIILSVFLIIYIVVDLGMKFVRGRG